MHAGATAKLGWSAILRLRRRSDSTALQGTHTTGELPPGFYTKPSQSRPGQLVLNPQRRLDPTLRPERADPADPTPRCKHAWDEREGLWPREVYMDGTTCVKYGSAELALGDMETQPGVRSGS